ncbi:hypothetical protein AVEN_267909-1 [Araneus ventricosus]|uniref:Mariner Mos1 transposase n=1 Tax=Araneus ventricosus TaxID=182803 RepID=A0A4Y2VVF9_ARAVE|nr:hypothetical protein AVEN_267909-1 [Araneus ventricosus]
MHSVYSKNCLSHQTVHCNIVSKLRDAIRRKCPGLLTRGILFHHDNARSHTARLTKNKIDDFRWQRLQYSSYSPELDPRLITCLVGLTHSLPPTRWRVQNLLSNEITPSLQ